MASRAAHQVGTLGAMVQARFPDDAVLDSIWDLHRVPRRRAMEWFAARREASVARRAAPPSRSGPVHTARVPASLDPHEHVLLYWHVCLPARVC